MNTLLQNLLTRNWKTTLAGVAAIVTSVQHMVMTETIDAVGMTGVITGIGLICGKDGNVTGVK